MDKENMKIDDQQTEEVSGGNNANGRYAELYAVMDELNGKTCKFCKKKFYKQAVLANYELYKSKMLRQFNNFGGKAVPCLYCDYWRNITDFE